MLQILRSNERGHSQLSWLNSYHSFSFADFYDPQKMGISVLRVLNEDVLAPGGGFAMHSHRDMEIITVMLAGELEHKDSLGNISRLRAGEIQIMSAGTGIRHSEYNASMEEPLHLLQIWIKPNQLGLPPRHQQQRLGMEQGNQLLVSPEGAGDSLKVFQNLQLYRMVHPGGTLQLPELKEGLGYLHLIGGSLKLEQETLETGDALIIQDTRPRLQVVETLDALLFDLPTRH
ncbi:pirin family protein [Dongshaea marina]|uniref:pirin family protein n=1 Tax=Dongshaea marina TaxID=2047966 RepID=UPI000D3EDA50|nr:pirin-like bicupin family protein [Dongshaea marina]